MRRLQPELVERVTAANDIVDVIGEYLPAEVLGNETLFRCDCGEFLQIDTKQQTFKCFGCCQGGSVLFFVKKHEGINLTATVRKLAKRAGMDIPEVDD